MRRARSVILLSGRMRLYGPTDRGGARLPFPRTTRKVSSSLIYASRNRETARESSRTVSDGDGGRRTEKAKRHSNFNSPITRTRYSSSSRWLVSRHASVELVIFTPRIARHVACPRRARHACAHYATHYAINPASVPSRCMKSDKLRETRITKNYLHVCRRDLLAHACQLRADACRRCTCEKTPAARNAFPRGTIGKRSAKRNKPAELFIAAFA